MHTIDPMMPFYASEWKIKKIQQKKDRFKIVGKNIFYAEAIEKSWRILSDYDNNYQDLLGYVHRPNREIDANNLMQDLQHGIGIESTIKIQKLKSWLSNILIENQETGSWLVVFQFNDPNLVYLRSSNSKGNNPGTLYKIQTEDSCLEWLDNTSYAAWDGVLSQGDNPLLLEIPTSAHERLKMLGSTKNIENDHPKILNLCLC